MRLRDHFGQQMDAEFDVSVQRSTVTVIQHSRSGGASSALRRNPDYFTALELLLSHLSTAGATIESIHVDSAIARQLAEPERRLGLSFPMPLSASSDPHELRVAITNAQRTIARAPDAAKRGGNNHKRIRIVATFESPEEATAFVDGVAEDSPGPLPLLRLGAPYRRPVVDPTVRPADVFTFDPKERERALASHARMQDSLAEQVRLHGWEPRSPRLGEPEFDLAWTTSTVFVAEVKSLSGANEDRQLRLGLGQVLHYRHQMDSLYGGAIAVLAVEHRPTDPWAEICSELSVRLVWPGHWAPVAAT